MIEAEHTLTIESPIAAVWDYVRDIRRWANLFPGCRECTVVDDHDSRWAIKVGAGGLVKTVDVHVHVDEWAGPQRVRFSYRLGNEPVTGSGAYTASAIGPSQTAITLQLQVVGSGPMAPMWEAVSRPLLPQLAKAFAGSLKAEIEQAAGIATARPPSILAIVLQWLRRVLTFRSLARRTP
ncbi:MAG TPA: SRPBCC family protein [Nevskiaceae bacterium]|nr:SRPBCC family protein [Nevskiaceae bacterium]